jgi:hypothetical protein
MNKTPAIIITEEGLIDNIKKVNLKWKEIGQIKIETKAGKIGNKIISFSLMDIDNFIKNIKNPYKRFISKLNSKYFQKEIYIIEPNTLKGKNIDIFSTLIYFYNNYK